MPTKDPEKRRAGARRRQARFKAKQRGNALAVTPGKVTPASRPGVTPGAEALVRKWGPLAAFMDRPVEDMRGMSGRDRIEAITGSLTESGLANEVRFGVSGPLFGEVAEAL